MRRHRGGSGAVFSKSLIARVFSRSLPRNRHIDLQQNQWGNCTTAGRLFSPSPRSAAALPRRRLHRRRAEVVSEAVPEKVLKPLSPEWRAGREGSGSKVSSERNIVLFRLAAVAPLVIGGAAAAAGGRLGGGGGVAAAGSRGLELAAALAEHLEIFADHLGLVALLAGVAV